MNPAAAVRPLIDRRRLARLSGVAATQVVIQAVSFLCGIWLVRQLPPAEYGLYTLALGLVGTAVVLGDLGLANAVLARAGQMTGDAVRRGRLLAQARRLQQPLLAASLLVLAPAGLWLLLHQGHGLGPSLLVLGLVAVTALLQLRMQLGAAIGRVLGEVALLQRLDLATHTGRLLLLLMLTPLWLLDAGIACLVNLAAAAVSLAVISRRAGQWAPAPAEPGADERPTLLRQLRQQAPHGLYFVLSSQLALWLIALFGNGVQVAEVGALGRLSALFVLVSAVTSLLVLPYFSRQHDVAALRSGLWAVNAFFGSLLAALLGLAAAAPGPVLWVLGPHYAGLQSELAWMLAAGALGAWGGTLYGIGCARGWVLPFAWSAPAGLATMGLVALLVDLATVRGVLMVHAGGAAATLVLAAGHLQWRLRRNATSAG